MSLLKDTPFSDLLDVGANAAAEPYVRGAEEALQLTGDDLAAVAADTGSQPVSGLGQGPQSPLSVGPVLFLTAIEQMVLPKIFKELHKHERRKAKRAIINATKLGVFEVAEALADGMAYQLMSIAETGELLSRYRSLYGRVVDSPDPEARCK